MNRALLYKELRECIAIAALGCLALFAIATANMGFNPVPFLLSSKPHGQIPFLNDPFLKQLALVAGALAIALGLKQSIGDFFGDAQLFVLHRPVSRNWIYLFKLTVGLSLYLLLAGACVLAYAIWAAVPGTHASPFDWQMTTTAWTLWLAMTAVYLSSFLSGIRPAAWLGTRLCPLAASVLIVTSALIVPFWWIAWPVLLAFDGLLVVLILDVVKTRDFA